MDYEDVCEGLDDDDDDGAGAWDDCVQGQVLVAPPPPLTEQQTMALKRSQPLCTRRLLKVTRREEGSDRTPDCADRARNRTS
eukprot:758402-Hanusia_phi.AAC.2